MGMTATLSVPQHTQMAHELLVEADLELAAGKIVKGSEMLWGATAHALIAVALRQGRPFDSHGALKGVARQLPNVTGQSDWLTEFNIAELLHRNFYHGQLTTLQIMQFRLRVHRLLGRLLAVTNEPV